MASPMDSLHPAVAAWFRQAFAVPSPAQAQGWPVIASGRNVLIVAPTGSGKTLAAFLQALSWVYEQKAGPGRAVGCPGVQVLYVSPLKALNQDVYRNLEMPLAGIASAGLRMGMTLPELRVAVRTGDTPARERREMLRQPPDILITTPESLFLLLSSQARRILGSVRFVIVDEVHALFGNRRGVQLSLCLEYLEELRARAAAGGVVQPLQRIGLSATVRPVEEAAAFLTGLHGRPATVVDTGQRKDLDLQVELPVEDLRDLPDKTIWPAIYRRLLDLVQTHRSVLIFVNNRQVAERVTAHLNDLAGKQIALAHHGSLAREVRLQVEQALKEGRLRAVVATSSLELGIDVGSVDLVVQVESPHGVARGLQRVGRAGHLQGLPSWGRILPKTRADLLEAAVIAREMTAGRLEPLRTPELCLDVLAQAVVGFTCEGPWPVDRLYATVCRAYPYRRLSWAEFSRVLAMLSGQPVRQEEFMELRPRLYWDQVHGTAQATDTGKRLVYSSGGTIPDRGYFPVYAAGSPSRLGELDEEFVFERRVGDRFMLGTSTWQVEEIRPDRVVVTPTTAPPTVLPFWRGEGFGRSFELGQTLGAFLRRAELALHDPGLDASGSGLVGPQSAAARLAERLQQECRLSQPAARNLVNYLQDQIRATGALPTDRRLVWEEFRDELGEWRIILHSPFGRRVNEPLAVLLARQWLRQSGIHLETVVGDDGILFLAPAAANPPRFDLQDLARAFGPAAPSGMALPEAAEPVSSEQMLTAALVEHVATTPLFGLFFRQNAARALLLPRPAFGRKRAPLWLSRLKAADLLQVVQKIPNFPVIQAAYRQIFEEAYDVRGLSQVLAGIRSGSVEVRSIRRKTPSPFAQPLVFGLTAAYIYGTDLPKAERRLRALQLDGEALRQIFGQGAARRRLHPQAVAETLAEASGLEELKHLRSPAELHTWLQQVGEAPADLPQFGQEPWRTWLENLLAGGQVLSLEWGTGRWAWVPAEYGPDYQAALGARIRRPVSGGSTDVGGFETGPVSGPQPGPAAEEALSRILARYARTHGPFPATQAAQHYGLSEDRVRAALQKLQDQGILESGEFLPGGSGQEWCHVALLRRLYRRSLAWARREVQPRPLQDWAVFLAVWQGVGGVRTGTEGLSRALTQLAGLALPAAIWERAVLPARVAGYDPWLLDQLISSGLFVWCAQAGGAHFDVRFFNAARGLDSSPAVGLPRPQLPAAQERIMDVLSRQGALSLPQIWQQTGLDIQEMWIPLLELVVAGQITNDTFGVVRYLAAGRSVPAGRPRPSARQEPIPASLLAQMGRWWIVPEAVREQLFRPDPEQWAAWLLARYGVLCREVAAAEGLPWGPLYSVLSKWEILGRVRRGYFVAGLTPVQFASDEAVESLRRSGGAEESGLPDLWAVAAADPANPWGRVVPWPQPQGAPRTGLLDSVVALKRGLPVLLARGRHETAFWQLAPLGETELRQALQAMLPTLARLRGRRSRLQVSHFDGQPVLEAPAGRILQDLGFIPTHRELVRWASQDGQDGLPGTRG